VEGIYFAAISFSDLRKVMAAQSTQAWLRILLFVSPIVFWLVCLFFAVRVFTPETYKTNLSSPQLAESLYREMVSYKHRNLLRAYWALLAGLKAFLFHIIAPIVVFFAMINSIITRFLRKIMMELSYLRSV
jgi:hypothetical protein